MSDGTDELSAVDAQVMSLALETLFKSPPTIGVVGVSGTGKSSTINAMFKAELPIGHAVACTKKFRNVDLQVGVNKAGGIPYISDGMTSTTLLRMVDAPGLGEDLSKDSGYLSMYQKHLGTCDVILWVMTARNRAIALDQGYLEKLKKFRDRIVFGINQIDLIEPLDWLHRVNLPSEMQAKYIRQIVDDRGTKLSRTLGRRARVVPYSAKSGWGLQELFTELTASAPVERQWIFRFIKNFSPYDFLPVDIRDAIIADLPDDTY